VFVRDLVRGTTDIVSVHSNGVISDGASGFSWLTADGGVVVFGSDGTNLVNQDGNGVRDVFLHR
jgi:hypothetical protein